jgi:DNA-binding transcriptional MerR regulator
MSAQQQIASRDDRPDLPPAAAAKRLNVTEPTLRTWRCRGKGPAFYKGIGRRILYRQSDLDLYIQSCRVEPGSRED